MLVDMMLTLKCIFCVVETADEQTRFSRALESLALEFAQCMLSQDLIAKLL